MWIFFRWRVPSYNCCQGQEKNNVLVHSIYPILVLFLGGGGREAGRDMGQGDEQVGESKEFQK